MIIFHSHEVQMCLFRTANLLYHRFFKKQTFVLAMKIKKESPNTVVLITLPLRLILMLSANDQQMLVILSDFSVVRQRSIIIST